MFQEDEEGDFVVVEFQRLNLQTLKFNHNLTRQVNHEVHFMAHSTHYHSTSALNLTTISSTISLFFQSSFHLSLTVLVRYRSLDTI